MILFIFVMLFNIEALRKRSSGFQSKIVIILALIPFHFNQATC